MDRRTALASAGSLGLAAVTGLAGCSTYLSNSEDSGRRVPSDWRPGPGEWSEWPAYGPQGNRYNPHADAPTTEPEVVWSDDIGGPQNHAWLAIADGTLYLSLESELVALDVEDGAEVWADSRSEFGSITYVDGRLYHAKNPGLEALQPDGTVEWRIDDVGYAVGEMEGRVYVRTEDGFAWFDADTGDRIDGMETEMYPVTAAMGRIYWQTEDGYVVYDVEGDDVSRRWEATVDGSFERGYVLSITEESVYTMDRGRGRDDRGDTRLTVYDQDGEVRHREEWTDTRIHGVIVADGIEYLDVLENDPESEAVGPARIVARDDGEELWRESFPQPASQPVVTTDGVYVTDGVGNLVALDRETGERRWTLQDRGGQIAVVEDSIFVNGHELYALRA